jgi:hypothetical protein
MDTADDDATVGACATVVQEGRDPASQGEGGEEAEAGEHRALATRAQVVMQVKTFFNLLDCELLGALYLPGHSAEASARW